MKYFLLALLLCCCCGVYAQNLVPNPSFEVYDACPTEVSQIDYAPPWFQPTLGTPDYYNACNNTDVSVPINGLNQNARTGVAYAGLLAYDFDAANYREYIEVKLDSTLRIGIKYFVSFFVSLADTSNHASSNLGLCFSGDSIKIDTSYRIPRTPQISNQPFNYLNDKKNWTKISGSILADSAYRFITIGNFIDDAHLDTTAVVGGAHSLGFRNLCYYYIDDVCVSTDSAECNLVNGIVNIISDEEVNINPNPSSGIYNVLFSVNNLKKTTISVYNILNEKILEFTTTTDRCSFDLSDYSTGVYYVLVKLNNSLQLVKKIIKN